MRSIGITPTEPTFGTEKNQTCLEPPLKGEPWYQPPNREVAGIYIHLGNELPPFPNHVNNEDVASRKSQSS